jgi:hypothetical protein
MLKSCRCYQKQKKERNRQVKQTDGSLRGNQLLPVKSKPEGTVECKSGWWGRHIPSHIALVYASLKVEQDKVWIQIVYLGDDSRK